MSIKFYITGTLAGELQDINKNGELIQVSGSANNLGSNFGSGSVAGVVLYNEGFVVLTGSWSLDPVNTGYYTHDANVSPTWLGVGQSVGKDQSDSNYSIPNASWRISFEGTNYIPTLTMFANAPRGMFNHSNNPTYRKWEDNWRDVPFTSSVSYTDPKDIKIKNTVSSSWAVITSSMMTGYSENSGAFAKQTYISKIGIYDENKNLIAIAKLAKPIRKTEQDDLTFKMKLDF